MKRNSIKMLALTAMFLALGLLLPFLTASDQKIGNMLLPMHFPVFLCALICGWRWAAPMALCLPPLRFLLFGMPPIYPTAVAMAFELAAYALVAGLLYQLLKRKNVRAVYISIITAMLAGRAVWGAAQAILLGFGDKPFTFTAFWTGAFVNAVPGIILQLILIPAVMATLDKAGVLPFGKNE